MSEFQDRMNELRDQQVQLIDAEIEERLLEVERLRGCKAELRKMLLPVIGLPPIARGLPDAETRRIAETFRPVGAGHPRVSGRKLQRLVDGVRDAVTTAVRAGGTAAIAVVGDDQHGPSSPMQPLQDGEQQGSGGWGGAAAGGGGSGASESGQRAA